VNDHEHDTQATPEISVIIPAYNSARTLGLCLESVLRQRDSSAEIIVVDDGSTDSTLEVASAYPVKVVEMGDNRGPAAARNRGVEVACGELLLFVDSDVTLADGALARARRDMQEVGVDAVIGSYDDEPAHRSTLSLFKNLAHHHFHQRPNPEVTTFWGACGIIRRDRFLAVGGFDERIDGIEDVELGYRLAAAGAKIRIDPQLQVKHHKRWTFGGLLRTEIGLRAIPWGAALRRYGYLPRGLNFTRDQRLAALLAILLALSAAVSIFYPAAGLLALAFGAAAAWINRGLYGLFWRKGGVRLLVSGFLLQQFYYLYALFGLVLGLALIPSTSRARPLITTDRAA